MTRPDEHPEEWLDSAVAGELSPARRRELDLHLAGCPACSAQLAAASRTARPSRPSDSERRRDRVAVERALARTAHRRVRPSRRSRALLVRLAASVVVLASAASASVWAAHKWDLHWLGRDPLPPVSIGEWVAPAPVPAAEPRPSDDAEKSTVPPAEPMAEPSPAPKPAAVARRRVAEKPSAAELLQQARDLRRGGNLAGATGVYRNLERLYPQSQEARVSYALLGRLLLERGILEQALAQFDQYLSAQGPLAEDALAGRASALERLSRSTDEISAWKTLVSRYPQSVYAGRARSRLRELGSDAARSTP